jgi:regulator of replication initiation timing
MSDIKKRLVAAMDSLPAFYEDLKTLLMDCAEVISSLEYKLDEAINLNLSFDAVLNALKDAEFEREQYKSQVEQTSACLAAIKSQQDKPTTIEGIYQNRCFCCDKVFSGEKMQRVCLACLITQNKYLQDLIKFERSLNQP